MPPPSPPPNKPTVVTDYLRDLQRKREADRARWSDRPVFDAPPDDRLNYSLYRGAPPEGQRVIEQITPGGPVMGQDEIRDLIQREVYDYLRSPSGLLILRIPAGVGKTHAMIDVAQKLSYQDWRCLFTASQKNFWASLNRFECFNRRLWYNWQPVRPATEQQPATCRYAHEMISWMKKGYPGMEMCLQLCTGDGHIHDCPFRRQSKRKEPIVYGRHEHLAYGVSVRDGFTLGVVDELPLKAFIRERKIGHKQIDEVRGNGGPLDALFDRLYNLIKFPESFGEDTWWGHRLLDEIGPILDDVFAAVEVGQLPLPEIPPLYEAKDVFDVPAFFWDDLLKKLSPEYECWKAGWVNWVPRVKVKPGVGLQILGRETVWENLPEALVVLDATGSPEIYEHIFRRPIHKIVAPSVKASGRIFQVVQRLNNITAVMEATGEVDDEGKKLYAPKKNGAEMLKLAEMIAGHYERPGLVTFKGLKRHAPECFGGRVLHFGGLRGRNVLKDVDCLIVAGGFCPPILAVMDACAAITDRMKPFFGYSGSDPVSPWVPAAVRYVTKDGSWAWRYVSGFWNDPDLRAFLEQFRQAELVQSIHRSRINSRPESDPVDVWVLTSIPTQVELDGVYQCISESHLFPKRDTETHEGVYWPHWLKIKPKLDELWAAGSAWVDAEMLAGWTGVQVETVRSQKWLSSIADYETERWILKDKQIGNGRPRLGLLAVES